LNFRTHYRLLAINAIKAIFKSYGVVYKAINHPKVPYMGATHYQKNEIIINYGHFSKSSEFNPGELHQLLSTAFHELGHLLAEELGKYKVFHKVYRSKNISKKEAKTFVKIAVRAERYIDTLGEKLMKDYFPDIPYCKAYQPIEYQKELTKRAKRICEIKMGNRCL
jgi:hypothetical protein